MKKWIFIILFAAATTLAAFIVSARAVSAAADESAVASPTLFAKLPYEKGQSFIVTQGYNTPPTHIKKDSYALDFTQNGCDAYGKAVVATASGTVMFASQEGYNGGYGTEMIIDHGGNIVSRYAHMIPDSITVSATGTAIRQGQTVGLLGDTGLVAGAACAAHPGTHLHFAMDTVNADGSFSAYDPEPLSGYTNIVAGEWYLSDNGDDAATTNVPADISLAMPAIATTTVVTSTSSTTIVATTTIAAASSVVALTTPTPVPVYIFSGGGSVSPAVTSPETTSTPTVTSTSTVSATSTSDTSENSTSTVDTATSTPDDTATSTQSDTTSTIATSTATSSANVTSSSDILFEQLDDSAKSPASWYDDNWFTLGNGFAGTLNALTLEGAVSNQDYLSSRIALQEFKDKNYRAMVQSFPISDDAPFTYTMATATFSGLSIPLKPYFYYRLATYQDWQNRSVILAGTATTTTGTVMWDNFEYGTGRVEYTGPFFPFVVMEGATATSTQTPPPLTVPTNLAENFDELGMRLTLSWSTSTDPDWPGNPLHYEMNYSTSTTLADDGWGAPDAIPVVFGNSYLIGVRAEDDFGDVSAAVTTTWNFPAGFTPYLLSPELGYAYQYFTVPSTSTLQSIELFTSNWQTGARDWSGPWCTLQLFDEYNLASVGMTQSDNTLYGYACAGTPTFSFASSAPVLYPNHQYHWVFAAQTGNPSTGASVQFYGTATDTAGGTFNDPSLVNAKFVVTGDSGVLFSN